MKRTLLLTLLLACGRHEEPAAPRPPAGEVWLTEQQMAAQQMRVETAEERPIATRLDAATRIAFDDLRVAHVFSPSSGRVAAIFAQPGQRVRKGTPLLALESPDIGAATGDLGKAEADLRAAERELSRQRELLQAHASSQRELEQAESAFERARAEVARARSRARMFGATGQRLVIRAPIDGEVIARATNPGAEVQGQYTGASPELFTIGSIDRVFALADVFEVDLSRVKVGADVEVRTVAWPDRIFRGRIEWISAALDPASRTARVRATLGNEGHELLPEMYATMSIATPARKALAIPRGAVLHAGEERIVFVQAGRRENGLLRFQRRRVVLDDVQGDLVPVKEGLQAGERVVVQGALLLSGML